MKFIKQFESKDKVKDITNEVKEILADLSDDVFSVSVLDFCEDGFLPTRNPETLFSVSVFRMYQGLNVRNFKLSDVRDSLMQLYHMLCDRYIPSILGISVEYKGTMLYKNVSSEDQFYNRLDDDIMVYQVKIDFRKKQEVKKYLEFMSEFREKPGSLYKYGCVMLELNITNWDEMINKIDPDDLYHPEDPSKGAETNPHVTIFFGLNKEVTLEQVKKVFEDYHEDLHVEIDGIGIFEKPDFDVVKMNVVPDGALQHLHDALGKLPNSDEYPTYIPHITLAYVKKGAGKKYINPDYKYTVKNIGKIKYSTPGGEKIYFDAK